MNYADVRPIEPSISSAWLIKDSNGRRFISLWHVEATVTDVIDYYRVHTPGVTFAVTSIAGGMFEVTNSKDEFFLSFDGRKVTDSLQVTI